MLTPVLHFSTADRAANYGDGLFTTMAVVDGQIQYLSQHLARLQRDAKRLGILIEAELLQEPLEHSARDFAAGVMKLLVSAGEGGRGYLRDESTAHNVCVSFHAMPAHYCEWRANGISLGVSDISVARQPLLAGIKHLNRLEQVLIKQQLASTEFDDCLVLDTSGNVIEASAANVFWLSQGQWYTPSLEYSGVAGVMREVVLARFATRGVSVTMGEFPLSHVEQADSILVCNALMQLVPVKHFAGRYLDIAPVLELQGQLDELACE